MIWVEREGMKEEREEREVLRMARLVRKDRKKYRQQRRSSKRKGTINRDASNEPSASSPSSGTSTEAKIPSISLFQRSSILRSSCLISAMTRVACLSLRSSAAMTAGSVVVASGTGVERPDAAPGPPGRVEAAEAEAIYKMSERRSKSGQRATRKRKRGKS